MSIRSALLSAGIAVASMTGCMVNAAPLKDFYETRAEYAKRGEEPPAEELTVRPEFRLGVKAAYTKTKIPESMRTTEGTTTRSPDGFDAKPAAGAAISIGSWIRLLAGAEAEWSATSELKSRHRTYEEEEHTPTSADQSTVVFTELKQPYALKPFLGIEVRIDPFKFRMEGRMPYSLIKVESGYLRADGQDSLQSTSWRGWGRGASASVLYGKDSGFRGGLFLETELLEPDFGKNSEIENILGFLQLEWRF